MYDTGPEPHIPPRLQAEDEASGEAGHRPAGACAERAVAAPPQGQRFVQGKEIQAGSEVLQRWHLYLQFCGAHYCGVTNLCKAWSVLAFMAVIKFLGKREA